MEKLPDKVREFADIAADLPENFQVACFELLLKHYLDSLATREPAAPKQVESASLRKPAAGAADAKTVEEVAKDQEDLTTPDLHLKVRRFLDKYSLSIDHLNNLFYREGDEILPLYDDLKTTRMAEGQVRVALLQALRSAFATGNFEASVEEVRQECRDRKCYDGSNFGANFRNNNDLFDFDAFTKSTKVVRLSESGRKELAEVVKELQ